MIFFLLLAVHWNTKSSSDDFILWRVFVRVESRRGELKTDGCCVSAPKRVKSLFAHKHGGVRWSEVHRAV